MGLHHLHVTGLQILSYMTLGVEGGVFRRTNTYFFFNEDNCS